MLHLQVFENQINRYLLLSALYKQSAADTNLVIDMQKTPEIHSLGYKHYQKVVTYLLQEQLIRQHNEQLQFLSITHRGIRAIEHVFKNIAEPTDYFPAYREMMK